MIKNGFIKVMQMITRDIHSNGETVAASLYDLKQTILLAKKQKEKIVKVIVGYGSTGKTHKIQTNALTTLEEFKEKHFIRDYIKGSDLDLFNPKYLSFKYKDLIPDEEKKRCNPGVIYIII